MTDVRVILYNTISTGSVIQYKSTSAHGERLSACRNSCISPTSVLDRALLSGSHHETYDIACTATTDNLFCAQGFTPQCGMNPRAQKRLIAMGVHRGTATTYAELLAMKCTKNPRMNVILISVVHNTDDVWPLISLAEVHD